MGRMLDALMRTEELLPVCEPETAVACAEPPINGNNGHDEEEMPFVEVGEPRKAVEAKAAEPKARLEMPAARHASLHVRAPLTIALQSSPPPTIAQPRVASELIAFHQPEHLVSQQYAALFAQIFAEQRNGTTPALAFTALAPGAGTTTSLLNIAIAGCGKHAQRIAVIDANFSRSAAAARLGVASGAGLAEVLQGKVALEQAIQSTSIKELHVLPAGVIVETANSHAEAIRWVLAWLGQRFDIVMLDAPAWDNAGGLRSLLSAASGVYLVVDATESEKAEVRAFARDLARQGGRLGGLILTR